MNSIESSATTRSTTSSYPTNNASRLCHDVALVGLVLFFGLLLGKIVMKTTLLFLDSHGWSHRLAGLLHWLWLMTGTVCLFVMEHEEEPHGKKTVYYFCYDVILGVLGILATLTAARDFPHRHVRNVIGQSGTLHRTAMVTQGEMMEHAFYQGLNLWQVLYLHSLANYHGHGRFLFLWLVTAPWLIRHWWPVHSFSHNWKLYQQQKLDERGAASRKNKTLDHYSKEQDQQQETEVLLYRIKKIQYIFYKHAILHGLNIFMALLGDLQDDSYTRRMIPYGRSWRLFWILLNTSYVMEFFLQTLVKRNVLGQLSMLWLQRLLMLAASLSALNVFGSFNDHSPLLGWWILASGFSVFLNFVHRHHDVLNTMAIALLLRVFVMTRVC